MKYLPILQELFESDTVLFMMLGIVAALMIGVRLKEKKKMMPAIITAIVVYAICEAASNIHTSFLLEMIFLLVGTVSIGCCLGFTICLLTEKFRKEKT